MRNKQYDIADSDRFIVYFGTVCDTIDLFVHGKEDLFYVYSLFLKSNLTITICTELGG